MLVLTRKISERIKVGDVLITVVRIGPTSVRIGIDAPPSVDIVREQLDTRPHSPPATRHPTSPCPALPAA